MKEIGGYFELDPGGGITPLPDGVLLISGRNVLRAFSFVVKNYELNLRSR